MKTNFLNRIAMLAFATVLCVAANSVFAQSQPGKTGDDPVSVHEREQRMAATVTNPGIAPQIAVAKNETVHTVDTQAPGYDAAVMSTKPLPSTGKVADEYADSKAWLEEFSRWFNLLEDPYLYMTKQQVDWFSTGDWERVYQDLKNNR